MSDAGTVSIPLETWDSIRDNLRDKDREIEALRAQLEQARLGGGMSAEAADLELARRYRHAAVALDAAVTIVNFAVGNLHPMTVRGWPYQALRQLGASLRQLEEMRGYAVKPELLVTWEEFTRWCAKWEDARALGLEQALLMEENASRAISAEKAHEYGLDVVMQAPPGGGPLLTTPAAIPQVAAGAGSDAATAAPATTTSAD